MPLVREAISPFRLIVTDKVYKCVCHISSHYTHKHILFLATLTIYNTTLTTHTLCAFFFLTFDAKSKTQMNVCIMIALSCPLTNIISVKELTVSWSVGNEEFYALQ